MHMHTLDSELTTVLRNGGALDNTFFQRCRSERLDQLKLQQLVANFYPITETFALSSFAYCENLSRRIAGETPDDGMISLGKLEEFLGKVVEVTAVEFKINHVISPDRFHFNSFCRLAPKLGMTVENVKHRRYPIEPETTALEAVLRRNFRDADLLGGLANIYAIETCALNIITALENAFADQQSADGTKLYSDHELEHISLHKTLEVEHDSEARQLVALLLPSVTTEANLKARVTELASLLSAYWNKLAK
jgi:hypothetical protein